MRMKRHFLFFFLSLLLVSCGTPSGHFKVEGRFMHLNQGEIYVYSPDGAIQGLDTIKVETGRFAYEIPCRTAGTLVLVFPNYSEHPIFTQSGKTATVKADASHLKEMKVTGTKDNELMSEFREMVAQVSPPEEARLAKQFILDHADSRVAVFLLRKYYLRTPSANAAEGVKVASEILKAQPDNGILVNLKNALQQRSLSSVGTRLPAFSAKDVNGKTVTDADLRKADMAVIVTWAMWNFSSQEMMRNIQRAIDKDDRIKALGICAEARKSDCTRFMENNTISFPNVCDGQMIESPLLQKLGLGTVPAVLILKKGKVVERNLSMADLRKRLDEYTK